MYNSQNLPLSIKKVYKKSILPVIFTFFITFIPSLIVALSFSAANFSVGSIIIAFLLTWLLLMIFFSFLIITYQYYYYKWYGYVFEEGSAEIKKGVIQRATGIVNYPRIQNIYVDQDLLDRIFGLYDVHYETAGESSRFYSHVDGLEKENADKLVAFLKNKVHGISNNNIEQENQKTDQLIEENDEYKDTVFTRNELNVSKRIIYKKVINSFLYVTYLVAFGFFYYFFLIKDLEYNFDSRFFLIIFCLYLVSPIVGIIYSIIWYKNFEFKFDSKIGFLKTSVLSKKMTYVYYDRIQNINISQSILDRILGMHTVIVENAGEGRISGIQSSFLAKQSTTFKGMNVPGLSNDDAIKLKDFLMDRAKKYKNTL